jgi:hypothetical protein
MSLKRRGLPAGECQAGECQQQTIRPRCVRLVQDDFRSEQQRSGKKRLDSGAVASHDLPGEQAGSCAGQDLRQTESKPRLAEETQAEVGGWPSAGAARSIS